MLAIVAGLLAVARASAEDVDEFIARQMSRQHIPGLSLAVLKDGKPVKVQGYGMANLETATPTTPETLFQIGSVSKQFIAAAILRLAEEGKLSLDDALHTHLSDIPETWRPITLRHLLTHTSGLVRETPGLQLKAQAPGEAIRAALPLPLAFAPGEKWLYSNLGYFVLAEVITRAAQRPWPQYVHERIFAPLGMTATRTTSMEELIPRRASGYHWMDGEAYHNAPGLPGVRPSGAFLSTALDMARWDAALRSDALFSPEQRASLWAPVKLSDGTEKPYGLGWELAKLGKHAVARHSGTMLGFRAHILCLRDAGWTIVVLTNATQALPERIAQGVAACYLPELKLPQAKSRAAARLPAENLARYTGRYQLSGGRSLLVTPRGERLAVSMPLTLPGVDKELGDMVQGVSMELALLAPESETRFFDEDDPGRTYVFSTDAQGRLHLATEDQNGKSSPPAPRLSATPADAR